LDLAPVLKKYTGYQRGTLTQGQEENKYSSVNIHYCYKTNKKTRTQQTIAANATIALNYSQTQYSARDWLCKFPRSGHCSRYGIGCLISSSMEIEPQRWFREHKK
jgi:hypothetical protein